MEKFLEQINNEAENLANEYMNHIDSNNLELRTELLKHIEVRLSILANAQSIRTSTATEDFTKTLEEQVSKMDFSNVTLNDVLSQMGNFNVKA